MSNEIKMCSYSHSELYTILCNETYVGTYTSYIRGNRCADEIAFFREFSAAMQFPWYFGENWAAFDECVCDLEWISFNRIIIAIDDFRLVFGGNQELQKCLRKYLAMMIQYWKNENISVLVYLNN